MRTFVVARAQPSRLSPVRSHASVPAVRACGFGRLRRSRRGRFLERHEGRMSPRKGREPELHSIGRPANLGLPGLAAGRRNPVALDFRGDPSHETGNVGSGSADARVRVRAELSASTAGFLLVFSIVVFSIASDRPVSARGTTAVPIPREMLEGVRTLEIWISRTTATIEKPTTAAEATAVAETVRDAIASRFRVTCRA